MSVAADQLVPEAIAFAARAHQGQLRKDKRTPYVSHVFRVAMTVCQVFGIADSRVLATAVLHDTIEDTPADYDDLDELFGAEIAGWVGTLTKNMSLPRTQREAAYSAGLTAAPWQVQVCKLADVFDNLMDSGALTPEGRKKGLDNARRYLEAIQAGLKDQAKPAWQKVTELYRVKAGAG
jgi:guanosine-3',5'-bis(diphosphate) 3'-pyrophosphohydrolase